MKPRTVLAILVLLPVACEQPAPPPATNAPPADTHVAAPTNRIAIPPVVRGNLGLTFARVERRNIASTLRLPGRFEVLPSARHDYASMLPGRVELLVGQFDEVAQGTPLFRLDAPDWRTIQKSIADAKADVTREQATLASMEPLQAAHDRHEDTLQKSVQLWIDRLARLEAIRDAGGGRSSELNAARASLATAEAELAHVQESDAELDAAHIRAVAAAKAATDRLDLLLDSTASLLGTTAAALGDSIETLEGSQPRWRTIETIEVVAGESGVVAHLDATDGAWIDAHTSVLQVVQPDRLRFHALGLQSDLGVLRDGLRARIVPPHAGRSGRDLQSDTSMEGDLVIGLGGDADDRTVNLYVVPDSLAAWARPDVTAQLEVFTDAGGGAELAVPLASVQRDGLERVLFRRDPDDPDTAIRIEADLGRDDGRWVEVLSGLRDDDEVVLDGGFQLMIASSADAGRSKGGHFHSDGTFHEGDH